MTKTKPKTDIEDKAEAEELLVEMIKESWNESVDRIAVLLRELETWRAGADNMARECERLKREIEAARNALDALREITGSDNTENPWLGVTAAVALIKLRGETARKVADAVVKYLDCDGDFFECGELWLKAKESVREYRARAEPAALSPRKQDIIRKACDLDDAEWEALVNGEVEC